MRGGGHLCPTPQQHSQHLLAVGSVLTLPGTRRVSAPAPVLPDGHLTVICPRHQTPVVPLVNEKVA